MFITHYNHNYNLYHTQPHTGMSHDASGRRLLRESKRSVAFLDQLLLGCVQHFLGER